MAKFRLYTIKCVLFILALQILNLSVYGNAYMQKIVLKNGTTTLELNQIDSFVEYVAEIVLNHANAIPEQEGNHTKNEQKTIHTPFQLFTYCEQQKENDAAIEIPEKANKYANYKNNYRYLYFKEINPPPPKTV